MAMTDPIADLLTRIRNAQLARHACVKVPASKIKESITRILLDEGYISGYDVDKQDPQDAINITLKYGHDRRGAILGIRRESTPGRRVYVGVQTIPRVHNGLGVAILSTSSGVVAGHKARQMGVGGEYLCSIW